MSRVIRVPDTTPTIIVVGVFPSDGHAGAFIAEFTLSTPDIRALLEQIRTAELRLVDEYRDRSGRERGIFWVTGEGYDQFESALSDSLLIHDGECLAETPTSRLYNIVVAKRGDLARAIECARAHTIIWERMAPRHGHLEIRAIVPDRDALQSFRDEIRDRGFDFRLLRATADIESGIQSASSLSEAQREVLVLAHECGYYEQPREVTLEEIGEELGISESAVSGRLNRGLSQLIEEYLSTDEQPGNTTGSS